MQYNSTTYARLNACTYFHCEVKTVFMLKRLPKASFTYGDWLHHDDVIMSSMASQITSLTNCLLNRLFGRRSKKTIAFVWGIHWWPTNSPHKGLVTRKLFPFDDVIMKPVWGIEYKEQLWKYMHINTRFVMSHPCHNINRGFTHLPLDKMVASLDDIFNAFSSMKVIRFRFKFHWNLFPGVQLTIKQRWFR